MTIDPSPSPAQRATHWQLRSVRLDLTERPLVMGIVNVTPDSFSDGGRYSDPEAAVRHALGLVEQGADLIDVGGESTRPYAQRVPVGEELRRVLPVVESLCRQTDVPLSIDTSKARVATEAVEAGAEIINDVTAATGDPEMIAAILRTRAAVCLMHMQGTPQTMQDAPHYTNVVQEVRAYLQARCLALTETGVPAEKICVDPGIGFGKTHRHNLDLLAHSHRLHSLGHPVLVGHSRKATIGWVLGDKQADRTAGTVGAALALARQGVQILRVHDVQAVRHAWQLFHACGGSADIWPIPKRR